MTSYYYCRPSGLGCLLWLFAILLLAIMYALLAVAWVLWGALVLIGAGQHGWPAGVTWPGGWARGCCGTSGH